MRFAVILICLLILALSGHAQPELDSYDDAVYRQNIRSVRMHINGLALTKPIAALGSMEALYLSFDDLDGRGNRYYYTVIHCDRHWQPTQELNQFDYLHGYREGEIRDFEFSSGTYQRYVHYKLAIPNEEVKWTLSGNYLLVVYEEGEENDPILTRRFLVVDEQVKAEARVVRPAVVEKRNEFQEVDFNIDLLNLRSNNPRMEVFCTVLQNNRWDNALQDIEPRLITGSVLNYDFTDKIVFPGGKEFRTKDISSMEFRSEDVLSIDENTDGYSILLRKDYPRYNLAYLFDRDLDGMYVPWNRDYTHKGIPADSLNSTLNLVNRYNYREQFLSTDYAEVIATLIMPEIPGQEVYVAGGFSDWKLLPENKMLYDERVQGYIARLYLKQGYYDMAYAVPDAYGNPNFSALEGDWYVTENQYTLLCYFRPRGGQYDQLVLARSFSSI